MPTTVGTVMLLCLLPVGTMVTGSIIVTFFQPGPKLTSAMQHFAAGIVLAAVAIELAPQLAIRIHGQNGVFTIAMLLGFFFAIGVLMLISRYFDADDDEDEGKKDDEVVKKKEPEIFTSNPVAGISTPTSAINLDIGSNKTTSTAYNSPMASPRSPTGGPSSLDVNSVNVSMPGTTPGEPEPNGRWQQPGYGNNNNNNNYGRNRDDSFPTQIDHIQYGGRGTMDSGYGGRGTMDAGYGGRGTMDAGYGGRGTMDSGYGGRATIGEGSEVSASSYSSNNSQTPLTRPGNSSVSAMGRGVPPRHGGYGNGGYNNNNNNGNNWNQNNVRAGPYPPPPGPPSMPEPEGDWNGNNNGNWGNNNNYNANNYGNGYSNERGQNMYNNQNWNNRARPRGQSTHTWQPRIRYAAQWKNQGRSDMGYVPPPPPRRNQFGQGGNNQWGNNNMRGGNNQNWNNTNRTVDQTHARMPSYMLHGSATTGLAKSIARNSFKATPPAGTVASAPMSFINTDLTKPTTAAPPLGAFNIPWGLIVAVAVDASTDGILIGIASAVGQGGIVIAIALSIEMSFLGISTSVEMSEMNVPKNVQIPLLMVLPGFILVGGAIGATVMAGVNGPLFVAFLAFGTAALLFLVTEELLISAHEDLAHDTWYVSISFFVGFMVVLIMDQFSGPNMCIDSIAMAFAAVNLDDAGQQLTGKLVLTHPENGIPNPGAGMTP